MISLKYKEKNLQLYYFLLIIDLCLTNKDTKNIFAVVIISFQNFDQKYLKIFQYNLPIQFLFKKQEIYP